MSKFRSNGALIKKLREESDQYPLQKIFAPKIGMSERQLRAIENNNAKISRATADRISEVVAVPWHKLIINEAPQAVPCPILDTVLAYRPRPTDGMLHFPRYDTTYARAEKQDGKLFERATHCFTIVPQVHTELGEETEQYSKELIGILSSVTHTARRYSSGPIDDEDGLRRRLKKLFILLKGNDIWIYLADHHKRLPESDTPVIKWDASLDMQLIVAFGPPGEYGEETIEVPVDNGHPFSISDKIQL